MEESQPPFVSAVGPEPASYLQASYLVGGKVLTFRVPLTGLSGSDFAAAKAIIADDVAKAMAQVK